jgi:hypothetical protein
MLLTLANASNRRKRVLWVNLRPAGLVTMSRPQFRNDLRDFIDHVRCDLYAEIGGRREGSIDPRHACTIWMNCQYAG